MIDVAQLEKVVPGFSYQQSQLGAPVFSIRGIGFSDFSVAGSPTVTTYVDQVPLVYAAMTRGAAFDVQQVEVLKGPQGTVFGQNSTGGAINFIAAKPTSDLEAGFDLEAGRFDMVNAQAFISGPLTSTLRARFSVRHESRGEWQRGYAPNDASFGKVGNSQLGDRDFSTGRFLLDWDPSSNVSFELSASGWTDRSDTQAPRFLKFVPNSPQDPFNAPTYAAFAPMVRLPNDARLAGWDAGANLPGEP